MHEDEESYVKESRSRPRKKKLKLDRVYNNPPFLLFLNTFDAIVFSLKLWNPCLFLTITISI